MKYIHLYVLFLPYVFCIACGQNPTNVPNNNIESEAKDAITSQVSDNMVRNVKLDRNGNILIASYRGSTRDSGVYYSNARLNGGVVPGKTSFLWDPGSQGSEYLVWISGNWKWSVPLRWKDHYRP